MPKIVEIEVKPFGRVSLNVWPAMTDNETKVFCEVQNNPFVPLVNAISSDARALGLALIEAADAAERAAAGIKSKGEA
jgi:hypothetical protein